MPATVSEPTTDDVLNVLENGDPRTVDELAAEFEATFPSTIRRRLDALLNQGKVRKECGEGDRVVWFAPRSR